MLDRIRGEEIAKKEYGLDSPTGVDIMSIRIPRERSYPLSENALRQLIRVAIEKGYYQETPHAENEHPERNLSTDDVLYGLEREDWTLAKPPNFDDVHTNWEYLIKTIDIEGEELHIKLAAFPEEKRFEVITRW